MEPVRVACPNCRGKLVVRSEWLLGQTIICPRCKTNVQLPTSASIAPATGVIAPVTFDSTAITRVDDGQIAQRLAEEPIGTGGLLNIDGPEFESAIEAFRPLHGVAEDSNPATPRVNHRTDEGSVGMESLEIMQYDSPISISRMDDWNHPATKKRRQLLMITMAGIAATLIALIGFVAFINAFSKPTIVAEIPLQSEPTAPPLAPAPPQPPTVPEVSGNGTGENGTSIVQPQIKPAETVKELMGIEAPLAGNDPQTTTSLPSQPMDANNRLIGVENPTDPIPPSDVVKLNPGTKPSTTLNDNVVKPSSVPIENTEIPDSMKRMTLMFDPGSLGLLSDSFASSKPLDRANVAPEKVDTEALYHPDSIVFPTWDVVQETLVPRLATTKPIPLSKLLITLSQLSNSGLGWDFEALRYSGFDVDLPVELAMESASIGDMIRSICNENRLVVTVDNQGLARLGPVPEEILSRLPSDWSISDFAPDDSSIASWKELITKLFPNSSTQWQFRGAEIQWLDTASPIQKATVAAFLDQVRVANQLTPKSTLPAAVIEPRLGIDDLLLRLSKPGTSIKEHAIALPDLLDDAARDVGLKLLLDWKNLFQHGLSYSKSVTSLIRARTWPEIAKWGIDEFSLVAVVDGANQVILTTLPQQRSLRRTMLLKLEAGTKIENLRESLRLLSPADDQGLSMLLVSPLPLIGKEPSNWVVARICPPNTAQLQKRAIREALQLPALQRRVP